MSDTVRGPVVVGALMRPSFRRLLVAMNADWQEARGLLESTFWVTGDRTVWFTIESYIEHINGGQQR